MEEIVGEFPVYEAGIDANKPHIIQSWVPRDMVNDPDPDNKTDTPQRWCVCLVNKYVELRKGDRVVVLRSHE